MSFNESPIKVKGTVDVIVIRANGKKEYYPSRPNLLTEVGRDFLHTQSYANTAAVSAGANKIAISADQTEPTPQDTELAGEITTGGLERTEADSITHVPGNNTTTISNVFTATTAFTALHKAALFNLLTPAGSTLINAATFSSDVDLAINDQIIITWTLTMG